MWFAGGATRCNCFSGSGQAVPAWSRRGRPSHRVIHYPGNVGRLLCLFFVGGPTSGRCFGFLGRLRLPGRGGVAPPTGASIAQAMCGPAALFVFCGRPSLGVMRWVFWAGFACLVAAGSPLPQGHPSPRQCVGRLFVCFLWEAGPRGDALGFLGQAAPAWSRRGRPSHRGIHLPGNVWAGCFVCFLWEAGPRGDALGFWAGFACLVAAGSPLPRRYSSHTGMCFLQAPCLLQVLCFLRALCPPTQVSFQAGIASTGVPVFRSLSF